MTTGEGGAVVTDDDAIASRIRVLREKGTNKHTFITENRTRGFYEYVDTGNSYVQSNILGALGVSQMKKIEMMNGLRRSIAEYYIANLSSLEEIEFIRITEGAVTNWHIFGILVPAEDRYWIMDALRDEGIMANVHYSPLHMNAFYRQLAKDADMPGSMEFFNRFLRLPLYPSLTLEERTYVVKAVIKVFNQQTR
jgi:dTDP-4-amino-4,6-dideoxygalactose transaminase